MVKNSEMSLSILIPTYNYDCSALLESLLSQAERLNCSYEIIVGDDGSTDGSIVKKLIHSCSLSDHCRLLRVKKNLGRAGIRNRLGHEASNDFLLFMDSDAEIVSEDFLSSYVRSSENHDVVSGFISHPQTAVSADKYLRYAYETSSERHFTSEKLNKMSYPPLSTFCFMIRRTIFEKIHFDESFTDYGYEDVMYGKRLRDHGHRVYYIPTPLQHNGMESNSRFVEKTEKALTTLKKHEDSLRHDVHLLQVVNNLEKLYLRGLVGKCLKPFLSRLRRNLCSDHANLRYLNLYKLGYYLNL